MNRLLGPILMLTGFAAAASAQTALYNFDNVPVYTPFPINVISNGVQAHLSGGYSIQNCGTGSVCPVGFSGNFVYPNSIYLADLSVSFSRTINAFSIQYSPQELGCDDSARMRVTAFLAGVQVGTSTTTCPNPGTWPVGTLAINVAGGFDSVVVHYDSRPPTCQDYGVIFLADNMQVGWSTAACYANCDGSTVAPILNVNDFTCFMNKYAASDPGANCDGSTLPPLLNVNDFICFQTTYAQGCP